MSSPRCSKCRKHPEELREYINAAKEYGLHPDDYVRVYEATYNPRFDLYFCTRCYIEIGAPTSYLGVHALEDGDWEVKHK